MAATRIGHYVLEGEVATDTTGTSYRAVHLVLPRRAVIKVMHAASVYPPVIHQPSAVEMLREACILEALHHPGVLRVYEVGLLADRRPWFAREHVDGATVESLLAPARIEPVDAIALVRDVADVLEHAHRRGVIHCGLRPERIVLTGRNRGFPICITGWDDARTHDSTRPADLAEAAWPYAPPELAHGDRIDDRTDVFALGVIAYQLFAGVLPEDVSAEALCPDLPRALTSLVAAMLACDRWDRPSMAEVRAELRTLATALDLPRPEHGRTRRARWTPNILELAPPDRARLRDDEREELVE